MKKRSTLYLTRGAMIAALYVALTYLSSLVGLASGVIQFRLSEMLCILPILLPEATLGLTLGCAIANLLTSGVIWDVIFGTLATFIGAVGARLLRKLPKKLIWLAPLPTVAANAIIVPLVLIFAYGAPESFIYLVFTVALGEIVCAFGLGLFLYCSLKKTKLFEER